ncbi:PREDICTED: probable methyltransferase At1g27930 [Nicotiana attenuata]|uniref:Methyltransferase n=1 Tax=Nicotiana attenuata TaxID=49451 RepID=A0A314LE54_NICAT|nr:PREDICTED: probable methyltransferase At1g27930 [Nicotiana attenuata]OIT39832.1 putative methyltransferase [Nicotiana attenuata]
MLKLAIVSLVCTALLISILFRMSNNSILCRAPVLVGPGILPDTNSTKDDDIMSQQLKVDAVIHYATSRVIPQQTLDEIKVSFDVLKSLTPCNFLVFGLGHDSFMWASINPRGTTLFLEEDPKWVRAVIKDAPFLRTNTVNYRTKLSEAEKLIEHYHKEPDCSAKKSFLRGNRKCKLALDMLSNEVYDKEWDMIMIDGPKGYFDKAPGRMSAIYSAAVMARNRKGSGVTHIFLHDVDRNVEKVYAELFLCRKNLVNSVGRLWHFEIPPAPNVTNDFC